MCPCKSRTYKDPVARCCSARGGRDIPRGRLVHEAGEGSLGWLPRLSQGFIWAPGREGAVAVAEVDSSGCLWLTGWWQCCLGAGRCCGLGSGSSPSLHECCMILIEQDHSCFTLCRVLAMAELVDSTFTRGLGCHQKPCFKM